MNTESRKIEVPFKHVRVDGTVYPIKHMQGVGFYVDVPDGVPHGSTIEALMIELKRRFHDVRPT